MVFECVSRTHVGCRRKVNEDALAVRTERGLWAVADGMGGHEAGDVASSKVSEALLRLPVTYGLDNMVEAAIAALQRVNAELIDLAGSADLKRAIGSTVVGLAIAGDQYRCCWAGDSRAYLVRDGEIAQISRDHSMVQDLVDAGLLAPEDAEGHPQANIITRAVGVNEQLRVDTVQGEARPGDQFLLASDGLTRLVNNQELATVLTLRGPEPAADFLIQTALDRGAPDNVTVVIVKLT